MNKKVILALAAFLIVSCSDAMKEDQNLRKIGQINSSGDALSGDAVGSEDNMVAPGDGANANNAAKDEGKKDETAKPEAPAADFAKATNECNATTEDLRKFADKVDQDDAALSLTEEDLKKAFCSEKFAAELKKLVVVGLEDQTEKVTVNEVEYFTVSLDDYAAPPSEVKVKLTNGMAAEARQWVKLSASLQRPTADMIVKEKDRIAADKDELTIPLALSKDLLSDATQIEVDAERKGIKSTFCLMTYIEDDTASTNCYPLILFFAKNLPEATKVEGTPKVTFRAFADGKARFCLTNKGGVSVQNLYPRYFAFRLQADVERPDQPKETYEYKLHTGNGETVQLPGEYGKVCTVRMTVRSFRRFDVTTADGTPAVPPAFHVEQVGNEQSCLLYDDAEGGRPGAVQFDIAVDLIDCPA